MGIMDGAGVVRGRRLLPGVEEPLTSFGDNFELVLDTTYAEAGVYSTLRNPVFDSPGSFYILSNGPNRLLRWSTAGDLLMNGEESVAYENSQLVYSPDSPVALMGGSRYRYGVDVGTGAVVWSHQINATVYASLLIPGTTDYIQTARHLISRRSLLSGGAVWSVNLQYSSSPYRGYLVAAGIGPDGLVYAYNVHTYNIQICDPVAGSWLRLWPVGTTTQVQTRGMTVGKHGITCIFDDASVRHYSFSGDLLWESTILVPGGGTFAVQGVALDKYGYTYVATGGYAVLCRISPTDGAVLDIEAQLPEEWRLNDSTAIHSVAITEDGLLLATQRGRIRVLRITQ